MKLNEIKNRVIEVLTDKHGTYFYVELPKIDVQALKKRLVAILCNKKGCMYIPDEEVDALAEIILPGVIAFFSTEEGRAEFEAWKQEREQMLAQKNDKAS